MSSTAPEPTATTMDECAQAPSTATSIAAAGPTCDVAPVASHGEEKSRYFLRNRPGHTLSALQVKQRGRGIASLATTAAAVASVAACSNQTPVAAAAAAAALLPARAPSSLTVIPASPPPNSSRFASFSAPESQSLGLRRSKRKAAAPVTPESSSSLSSSSTRLDASNKNEHVSKKTLSKNQKRISGMPLPSLRTESFQALTPDRFPSLRGKHIVPHTLIVGTHPSIKSLQEDEYYRHAQNAFWWIAGDCLGFRRGTGISESTGKPFQLALALRHGPEKILSYPKQTERLIQAGFLLWDVVGSCERAKGSTTTTSGKKKSNTKVMTSLDQDIKNEVPNDIRSFCTLQYPSVRRIVFANGQTGSSLFCKHNKEWLASGELKAGADELSQRHLAKACGSGGGRKQKKDEETQGDESKIELIAAISVSPAAARFTYKQKRDWWETNVYQPGLQDHAALLLQHERG